MFVAGSEHLGVYFRASPELDLKIVETISDPAPPKSSLIFPNKEESVRVHDSRTCPSRAQMLLWTSWPTSSKQTSTQADSPLCVVTVEGQQLPTICTAKIRSQFAVRSAIHEEELAHNLQCFLLAQQQKRILLVSVHEQPRIAQPSLLQLSNPNETVLPVASSRLQHPLPVPAALHEFLHYLRSWHLSGVHGSTVQDCVKNYDLRHCLPPPPPPPPPPHCAAICDTRARATRSTT